MLAGILSGLFLAGIVSLFYFVCSNVKLKSVLIHCKVKNPANHTDTFEYRGKLYDKNLYCAKRVTELAYSETPNHKLTEELTRRRDELNAKKNKNSLTLMEIESYNKAIEKVKQMKERYANTE